MQPLLTYSSNPMFALLCNTAAISRPTDPAPPAITVPYPTGEKE
jgi:hypothetical protein